MGAWTGALSTPFKKATQHDFNRLYQFVYGFIFIMLGIIWKLGYLSFHWYFILLWLLCRNVRREIKLGSMSKNVAKLDHNFNRWYQFVYEIIFIMLGIIWKPIYISFNWYIIDYIRRNVKKINVPKLQHYLKFSMMYCFGRFRYNEWAVGACAYAHKREAQSLT